MAQGIEEAPEREVKRHSEKEFNIKKGDCDVSFFYCFIFLFFQDITTHILLGFP